MDSDYTQNKIQTPYNLYDWSLPIFPTSSPAALPALTHDSTATLDLLAPPSHKALSHTGFAEHVV